MVVEHALTPRHKADAKTNFNINLFIALIVEFGKVFGLIPSENRFMESVCNIFLKMFVWARVAVGLLSFALVNVVAVLVVAVAWTLFFAFDNLRSRTISAALRRLLHFNIIGVAKFLGGYDLFIDTSRADFSKPAVYVANHISLFDPLLLLAIIPNAGVVVKQKYSPIPAIWLLSKAFDFVVVRGDSSDDMGEVLGRISRAVSNGRNMLVFPEGRRAKVGRVLDFKKAPFKAAKELNLPVVPVAIYSPRPFLGKGEFAIKEKTYYKIKFLEAIAPEKMSYQKMADAAYCAIGAEISAVRDKLQERPQRYQTLSDLL